MNEFHSQPREDPVLLEAIEWLTDLIQRGEPPNLDELLADHPEYESRLAELLPMMEVLAEIGRSAIEGRSAAAHGPLPVPEADSLEGTLGDYRIVREIGRGGMGVVYEAEQLSLRRRVALKVLPFAAVLDSRQLQRFKNEALAAAQLKHPHIVSVLAVGCERGVHFYTMEYVKGRTLAELIEELRQARAPSDAPLTQNAEEESAGKAAETQPLAGLSTEQKTDVGERFRCVARLGEQAAEALEHAHRLGVIHRDVKPANLIVNAAGHLWVTDFGLAQVESGTALTMTGDLVGTLRYMSPEQASGERRLIDHRTDTYSLGVTLYELATLEPAVSGAGRREVLRQVTADEPLAPRRTCPAVPRELETIILKATARDVPERYQTAQELADDLRRFLEHRPILACRPSLAERLGKWSRRHRRIVWAALVVLLLTTVALGVATALVSRQRDVIAETSTTFAFQPTADSLRRWGRTAQCGCGTPPTDRLYRC